MACSSVFQLCTFCMTWVNNCFLKVNCATEVKVKFLGCNMFIGLTFNQSVIGQNTLKRCLTCDQWTILFSIYVDIQRDWVPSFLTRKRPVADSCQQLNIKWLKNYIAKNENRKKRHILYLTTFYDECIAKLVRVHLWLSLVHSCGCHQFDVVW